MQTLMFIAGFALGMIVALLAVIIIATRASIKQEANSNDEEM